MKDHDMRIDGEYDRPLPERLENPTKEDQEKLLLLIKKYARMAFDRKQIAFMKKIGISADFSAPLSDADYEAIEEIVSTRLQKHGFDVNYLPTKEGEMCEAILDTITEER